MKRILLALIMITPIAFGDFFQLGNDIDGEAQYDDSGSSVALSSDGSIVAIGASGNDGNGVNSGHVRLYQWNGVNWNQLGSDIDGEASNDFSGTSVALSSDGFVVAIGAEYNGSNSGHVRLYQWNGVNWNQLGSDIDGEASNDSSGTSVALSSDGSVVAIGAVNNNNGTASGHVRLYQWDGVFWNQLGNDIDGEAEWDASSGYSVALSSDGSIVAIGASGNDGNGVNSGHVRIYQWNGSSWNQLGSDIDGEAQDDLSGSSVALSSDGSIVAIGAPDNDVNGSNSGHVRLYEWDGSSWSQLGNDIDGEAQDDLSGSSVALSSDGSIVAIGAPYNNGTDLNSGHVRLYQWTGSSWNQLDSDIDGEAVYDSYGTSVALSSDGSIVAIGAPFNDGNGYDSGHVRVYLILPDSDLDGLIDDDEINIHLTDPFDSDSDDDGLSDGYEVNISSTNPNDDDGDSDGLSDGDEVFYSTNPNQSDSDSDGLSDGLEVNTYLTNPALADSDGDSYNDSYEVTEGSDPNDYNELPPNDDFDDDGLTNNLEAINGTNPRNSDTDGDGLSDEYEVNNSSTNPNDDDSDSDGLSDYNEIINYSTDPNNIDSDDDDLSDYFEIINYSTDPNDADTDDDGLSDGYEVNISLSNPRDLDSDDDGLSDGYEVNISSTNPNDDDGDDDGLEDGEELFLHTTNPHLADTDNDGLLDWYEINVFMTIATNADSSFFTHTVTNTITNNAAGYSLSDITDLRVGSQTFGVSNGNAKIRMYVDESSDLTSTWSNTQHVLELDIPADADTKFYRFRMD
jgi:hypothetical protein